ncbi:YesL family protein [Alkalicoccus halolimnae]|uniref:DUF624 domain-containing protein n=1 Tax=Alkalicoccus halolimnae TaxID=1667239 RepID=A0A5C7F173_9BACI|nr:DUF624 domain-containing protein [Alkalicoccus halolimnae]TXF83285.1 DUF624 domain-containing protein [Alkalicoccus halolimnae]
MEKLEKVLDWIFRLAYLNILWIAFTLLGLGIFGAAPALAAVYEVLHKWMKGEEGTTKTLIPFWNAYKRYFLRANLLMLLFAAGGAILYVDFYFIFRLEHTLAPILLGVAVCLLFLYIILFLFSFPLLVHRRGSTLSSIKSAAVYGLSSPVLTVTTIVSIGLFHYILYLVPVLYLFFSVSAAGSLILLVTFQKSQRLNIYLPQREDDYQNN